MQAIQIRPRLALTVLFVFAFSASAERARAVRRNNAEEARPDHVQGVLIIKFTDGTLPHDVRAWMAATGNTIQARPRQSVLDEIRDAYGFEKIEPLFEIAQDGKKRPGAERSYLLPGCVGPAGVGWL